MTALRHRYPTREATLDLALHAEVIAEQSALDLAALTGAAGDRLQRQTAILTAQADHMRARMEANSARYFERKDAQRG